jgi:hypothetical protein
MHFMTVPFSSEDDRGSQLYNPEDDHAKLQRSAALTHIEKNKRVSSFTQDEDFQAISITRSHFKSIDVTLEPRESRMPLPICADQNCRGCF